ncbi:MAG TPA: IS630 family transposase [Vicinamibacteria bacterium]|nr:IS630 family transposase [Vicinamibacteria bacterium]
MVAPAALDTLRTMIRQAVGRVSRRAQAVSWWLAGQTQTEVAERLGVSRQSVVAWCGRFQQEGPAGLQDRPRSGRPPRLDAAGTTQLRTLVGGSDLVGTTGPGGWTTSRLAAQLTAVGWGVSRRTVRRALRRLRARWRRGRLVAKGDPQRRAVLQRLVLGLQAAARAAFRAGRRLIVLFEDEADLALLPHTGCSWQLADQPAAVCTPGRNAKVGLFGSVSLDGELIVTEAARKTAVAFTVHLTQVVARFPAAELVIILDNVGIHHAKATVAWVAAHPQVHRLFLPRYSPNDNAQERVWGWLREDICRNRVFPDLAGKRAAALRFLQTLTPAAVSQRCVPDRLLTNLLVEAGLC